MIMIMIHILYMIHNLYMYKYIIYYAKRNAKSDDVYHHIVILCLNKHYLYDDDLSRFSIH